MNREGVAQSLIRIALNIHNKSNIGVLFSSNNEISTFREEFYTYLEQVPYWLFESRTGELLRDTKYRVEFEMLTVSFFCNANSMRGHAFSTIFQSNNMPTNKYNEYAEILIRHKFSGGRIHKFDNE
jgi:hypothetical protein